MIFNTLLVTALTSKVIEQKRAAFANQAKKNVKKYIIEYQKHKEVSERYAKMKMKLFMKDIFEFYEYISRVSFLSVGKEILLTLNSEFGQIIDANMTFNEFTHYVIGMQDKQMLKTAHMILSVIKISLEQMKDEYAMDSAMQLIMEMMDNKNISEAIKLLEEDLNFKKYYDLIDTCADVDISFIISAFIISSTTYQIHIINKSLSMIENAYYAV